MWGFDLDTLMMETEQAIKRKGILMVKKLERQAAEPDSRMPCGKRRFAYKDIKEARMIKRLMKQGDQARRSSQ